MATTTTSSKKKSTSKKKTSKSAASGKTSPAAAKKKTTTKKSTTTNKTASSAKSKPTLAAAVQKSTGTPAEMLKKITMWNTILSAVYALGGVALIVYGEATYRAVTTAYLTQNSFNTSDDAVAVQAVRSLADMNVLYKVSAVLFVAAAVHALMAFVRSSQYEQGLRAKSSKYRWLEFGLTNAMITSTVALMVGVSDVVALGMISALVLITAAMGIQMDHNAVAHDGRMWLRKFRLRAIVSLVPWLVIGWTVLSAHRYGTGGVGRDLYWIVGAMFGLMAVQLFADRSYYSASAKSADFLSTEWTRTMLSFLSKAAFVGLMYYAFFS